MHMNTQFWRSLAVIARITLGVVGASSASSAVAAEPFPTKPVRIVVTSATGGLLDMTTRIVARQMGEKLGQPVIVGNRAGAGGLIAIRSVRTAPVDGYTLLAATGTVAIQPAVMRDPGYDLLKDFTGVGPMTRSPLLMLTAPDQPDKNVVDFLARAKANPGKQTYASAGVGTATHLGPALFALRAGVDLLHVPYKGNPAAWPDVISGRVGTIFEPYGSGASMMREGRLRALGISSNARLKVLPEIATIAEQGVPDYSYHIWIGLLAPAGTPKDIVRRLSDALRSALSRPDLSEQFRNEGSETMSMSVEEFDAFLTREVSALSKLVADLGVPKQ